MRLFTLKGQTMFEIKQETMQVKLSGEVIEFRAPTSLEEESLSLAFKEFDVETSSSHPTVIYKDFLGKLGIPREKLDQLSSKNITDLFSFAIGSKKN